MESLEVGDHDNQNESHPHTLTTFRFSSIDWPIWRIAFESIWSI